MQVINEVPMSVMGIIEETKSICTLLKSSGNLAGGWLSEYIGQEGLGMVMWIKPVPKVQRVLVSLLGIEAGKEGREEERERGQAEANQIEGEGVGSRLRLRRANRSEVTSIPARVEDLIAVDHPARLIWEEVERMELSSFYAHLKVVEGGPGQAGIDPQILVALWIYASSEGVDSARELNKLCVESLPYIWLCGGVKVNYHTLSDFRVKHQEGLDELMTQLLGKLNEVGLINWENQAQDGMRVRASAGAASFRREATLEKGLTEAKVALAAIELGEKENEQLTPGQKAAQERAAREKVVRYEAALTEMPAAQAAKKAEERDQARVSTTDPTSRVMKMADGGYRPAYNWQFAVETTNLIITGVDVVNTGSDKGQMLPMLTQVKERHHRLPKNWLNDGGFVNLSAIVQADQQGVIVYAPVSTPRDEKRDPHVPLPTDPSAVAEWRKRMGTEAAKELYKERAASVECVNAQTRSHQGIQQVRVRGQAKVKCVALWTAITHNLLIWIKQRRQTQNTALISVQAIG